MTNVKKTIKEHGSPKHTGKADTKDVIIQCHKLQEWLKTKEEELMYLGKVLDHYTEFKKLKDEIKMVIDQAAFSIAEPEGEASANSNNIQDGLGAWVVGESVKYSCLTIE